MTSSTFVSWIEQDSNALGRKQVGLRCLENDNAVRTWNVIQLVVRPEAEPAFSQNGTNGTQLSHPEGTQDARCLEHRLPNRGGKGLDFQLFGFRSVPPATDGPSPVKRARFPSSYLNREGGRRMRAKLSRADA